MLQHFHIEEQTDPGNCCALSNGKLANAGKGQAAKPANAQRGINQRSESGSFLRTSALTASFLNVYQPSIRSLLKGMEEATAAQYLSHHQLDFALGHFFCRVSNQE